MKQIILPKPSGPYAIGTTRYNLLDTTRIDPYSSDPAHSYRELIMQVWYPADTNNAISHCVKHNDYISAHSYSYIKQMIQQGKQLPGFIEHSIRTNAYPNISVSTQQKHYPVALFSHGFGNPIYLYTSFLEELASHGFIVAAVEHTYRAEPTEFDDGRIIGIAQEWYTIMSSMAQFEQVAYDREMDVWVKDLQCAINKLEKINVNDPKNILSNALDLQNLGAFGHSFGGSAVVQLCRSDNRFKAGVNIDGSLFGKKPSDGFNKPFMLIAAGDHQLSDVEYAIFGGRAGFKDFFDRHMSLINTFMTNLTSDKYYITFENTRHSYFSDSVFFNELSKARDAVFKTNKLLIYFFKQYLQSKA